MSLKFPQPFELSQLCLRPAFPAMNPQVALVAGVDAVSGGGAGCGVGAAGAVDRGRASRGAGRAGGAACGAAAAGCFSKSAESRLMSFTIVAAGPTGGRTRLPTAT